MHEYTSVEQYGDESPNSLFLYLKRSLVDDLKNCIVRGRVAFVATGSSEIKPAVLVICPILNISLEMLIWRVRDIVNNRFLMEGASYFNILRIISALISLFSFSPFFVTFSITSSTWGKITASSIPAYLPPQYWLDCFMLGLPRSDESGIFNEHMAVAASSYFKNLFIYK